MSVPDGPGRPPVEWPSTPPLAPPPPVVPAPWANRRPFDPPPPAPPPDRTRRGVLVALAVLVAIALLAGAAFAVTRDHGDHHVTAGSATTTTAGASTTGTAATDEFDHVIADITAFVEQERGLTFKSKVRVELADDTEFNRRLLKDFNDAVDDLKRTDDVFTALGLLSLGDNLVKELRSLYSQGVVGFYDPATNELVVRGTETTPYVRTTIAHELTHALDDQYFELNRPALQKARDETGFAFSALTEGDAVRVQNAYHASLSAADQAAADDEEAQLGAGLDLSAIPQVLVDNVVAPYQYGPVFVDALLADGGQPELDKAFTEPPTTSEQFMDPQHYIEGDAPKAVPVPAADGAVFDQGTVGAFTLGEMLDSAGSNSTHQAVDGWGGDVYVAWHDGDRSCVRAAFVGDSDADTTEIYDALKDWAGQQDDAQVDMTEVVTLTACR
jgi:hypothetical protein